MDIRKAKKAIGKVAPSHLEIWDEVMTEIEGQAFGSSSVPFSTEGLVRKEYCKDSGKLFCDVCAADLRGDRMTVGYFTEDNMPTGLCDVHISVAYDLSTNACATEYCPLSQIGYVSLLRGIKRSFPTQIYVTDAQYVYEEKDEEETDYFNSLLRKKKEYAGVSAGKKQFHDYCKEHLEPDE